MRFFESWTQGVGAPLLFENNQGRISLPEKDYSADLMQCVQTNPATRLGAYRTQYWFRLFNILQAQFPRLGALMGWELFNPMAQNYILAQGGPARSLSNLGTSFAQWVHSEYGTHHPLWVRAARLDWAHHNAFYAPQAHPLRRDDINALFTENTLGEKHLHCHPSLSIVDNTVIWRLNRRILQRDVAAPVAEYMTLLQQGVFWIEALAISVEKGRLTHAKIPELFADSARNGWLV